MMSTLKLHLRDVNAWGKSGETYARGSAFRGSSLISRMGLAEMFSGERTFDGVLSLLKQLNGFFAVVHRIQDAAFLAVDHVRAFPLFYGAAADGFFVSDDPHWIRREISDEGVDELSAQELLTAGFVTGCDTLSHRVKQVQPGEALVVENIREKSHKNSVRYYEHVVGDFSQDADERLVARLDDSLQGPFKRLIQWAHGRTIVIPLSGGSDSRLVALMLKRLGYTKLVAFSYGRPGNRESRISERVASSLDIPWFFIAYSNESWRKWSDSPEWEEYCKMADGLSTVPHIQDWPAVWMLRERALVPIDSVFVPGHLVSHILPSHAYPTSWQKSGVVEEEELVGSIWRGFYDLRDLLPSGEEEFVTLKEKIQFLVGRSPPYTTQLATEVYERWWWQSYEKFIINSVRVYEFWGYEWWLPLWDLELARFWSRVPINHRLGKRLQRMHLRALESTIMGRNVEEYSAGSRYISLPAKLLKATPLYSRVRGLHGRIQYDKHPLAWYGIIPRKTYNRLYTGEKMINYYLALETLHRNYPKWRNSDPSPKLMLLNHNRLESEERKD
ncbi:MAG: asparagine synthase C-terminal domain-containing protein [Candidatus Bathyarchaeia archaeon]